MRSRIPLGRSGLRDNLAAAGNRNCSEGPVLSMEMTRCLVTGARGFVGQPCLRRLAGLVGELHATTSEGAAGANNGVIWHHIDLLEPAAAAALVEKVRPTHLLHLAWIATP